MNTAHDYIAYIKKKIKELETVSEYLNESGTKRLETLKVLHEIAENAYGEFDSAYHLLTGIANAHLLYDLREYCYEEMNMLFIPVW